MITLWIILFLSFALYFSLYYNKQSVFVAPDIAQMVFFRDYLVLTLLSYFYILHYKFYNWQYILKNISSPDIIVQAGVHAFIFMVIFMLSYTILLKCFRGTLKKVKSSVNYKHILFYLKIFSFFLIIYFSIISVQYSAGIIGILKYTALELIYKRAELSHGSGVLQIHKFIVQSWIPMTSYLLYYLYLKGYIYKKQDKFLMYIMIVVSLFASIWYFEKSTIVFYFLGLVGVYIYSGYKLNKKFVILTPLIIFSLVALMYLLIYQDRVADGQYLLDIILFRSVGQADGSIVAVDYFTQHEPFGISGISHILADIVGEKFQTPYGFLIDYYDPSTSDTSGAISSFAVGEAFGLFGYIGVVISGIIVAIYYAFFEASKYSQLFAIMIVPIYAMFFAHPYVAGTFYIFIWPVNLVLISIPYIIIGIVSTKRLKR